MASSSPCNARLEVCIASVDDALIACANGADRLELNSALSLGGLTPSMALMRQVRQAVAVPIIVMVRPRAGGFFYSESDMKVMLEDARAFIAAGADGIAFGFLDEAGRIDVQRCREMMAVMGGGEAVFHRAFDVTPDPHEALEQLIELGIKRVMTSGQMARAEEGLPLIAQLIEQAAGRIEVLPASGIRPDNVRAIMAATGCTQVHGSLRTTRVDESMKARPHVRFSVLMEETQGVYEVTDGAKVKAVRDAMGKEKSNRVKERESEK